MRRLFVRSLLLALVVFTALFGLELFLELRRAGFPGPGSTSWAGNNNAKLVDILSPVARAYNNVLAMLLATIGLAIPLTANMHTPTLIDLFLRDRINRAVLSFMALGAAHVLWVDYMIGPKFAPTWAIALAVYLAILGWVVLIPYFFYVVRFLEPATVIGRLRQEVTNTIRAVASGAMAVDAGQHAVTSRVDQVGTIVLKALDRGDRGTAREGVWALKLVIDEHAAVKARMPAGWFRIYPGAFVGRSHEALEMLDETRTWFEMKCLWQLWLAYQQALPKASDAVSSISDVTRIIAQDAEDRDDEVNRLCIRFFNNFLRESIKAKNLHAIYDTFQQYRLLGRELCDKPDRLCEIGDHFVYYAHMARGYGLVFAPQQAVFDLGYLVRRAYEAKSPAGPHLLAQVLRMPHRDSEVHSLAVKAKLILGGFFLEIDRPAEARQVADNLADVAAPELVECERGLLAADRVFFEVTDRQVNLEYVPPERREPLQRFCASILDRVDEPEHG
ncbi:MAG TPA: DUF2254 family protein [Kofleriaceae bacterium]|nr:DUF2254 family protein [Kofleriaceae bacterium]